MLLNCEFFKGKEQVLLIVIFRKQTFLGWKSLLVESPILEIKK